MRRRAILFSCLLLLRPAQADEWQKLVRGPFVVWVHAEDVRNAQRVLLLAERSYQKICAYLDEIPGAAVVLVVATSEDEFTTMTHGQIPEWGVAAADPVHGTVILKSPRFSSPDIRRLTKGRW